MIKQDNRSEQKPALFEDKLKKLKNLLDQPSASEGSQSPVLTEKQAQPPSVWIVVSGNHNQISTHGSTLQETNNGFKNRDFLAFFACLLFFS